MGKSCFDQRRKTTDTETEREEKGKKRRERELEITKGRRRLAGQN